MTLSIVYARLRHPVNGLDGLLDKPLKWYAYLQSKHSHGILRDNFAAKGNFVSVVRTTVMLGNLVEMGDSRRHAERIYHERTSSAHPPLDVIVWGAVDLAAMTKIYAAFNLPDVIGVHGNSHTGMATLFDTIEARLAAPSHQQRNIRQILFAGRGDSGSCSVGPDLLMRAPLCQGFKHGFARILPYLSDGAVIAFGGVNSGFGARGLKLLEEVARLGKKKSIVARAGRLAEDATTSRRTISVQWRATGRDIIVSGDETRNWEGVAYEVSSQFARLVRLGDKDIAWRKRAKSGTLQHFRQFMRILMTKSQGSFVSENVRGGAIERAYDEHVQIFGTLTVAWLRDMRDIDRAALFAELAGNYDLRQLEQVVGQNWYQQLTTKLSDAHRNAVDELYVTARHAAHQGYPQLFAQSSLARSHSALAL